MILVVLCGMMAAKEVQSISDPWTYGQGMDQWASAFPECGDPNQSPIDIVTQDVDIDIALTALAFKNYNKKPKTTLENTGATVSMFLEEQKYGIYNGGLNGEYHVEKINFRWGTDSSKGSDHTIDGDPSPLELHIVHAYGNRGKQGEGIVILAVRFEVDFEDNPVLKPIIDALQNITKPGTSTPVTMQLKDFIPFDGATNYFRYEGQLSNPPCSDGVIWNVFRTKLHISEQQLAAFRNIETTEGQTDVDRFRPTQPINGRSVRGSIATIIDVDYGNIFSQPDPPEYDDSGHRSLHCVDLMVVIDNSCSVYEDMNKVRMFLFDVLDGIIMGENAILMSMTRYNTKVKVDFVHSATTSTDKARDLIAELPLGQTTECKTKTYEALKKNYDMFFSSKRKHVNMTDAIDFGVRDIAPDIMVVITDGTSIPMWSRPFALAESDDIRREGGKIYTIGLINQNGRDGEKELQGFVGQNNVDKRVFDINDEGLANAFINILNAHPSCGEEHKEICDKLDIIFIIDTSQSLMNKKEKKAVDEGGLAARKNTKMSNLGVVKRFFREIIKAFPIGQDRIRIAILSFDEKVIVHQRLSDTTTGSAVDEVLLKSVQDWPGVGTRTDIALKIVLDDILQSANGDRPGVKNLIFLATDGMAYTCCDFACCQSNKILQICQTEGCISNAQADKDVVEVATQLKENSENDLFILALPNKPDWAVRDIKRKQNLKKAQAQFRQIVRNPDKDIKNITRFGDLKDTIKDTISRLCRD